MNDEELKLQEDQLAIAKTREQKLDAWLLWWPHMSRCIASLNRKIVGLETKIEQLSAEIAALTQLVSTLHPLEAANVTPAKEKGKPAVTDPRLERLRIILAFAQRNWQGFALLVILAKAFGLLGDLTLKDLLPFLN